MTIITYLCHPKQGVEIHRNYSDLRALSIQPPWIEEILNGTKIEEYRTWPTKRRGQFLLHESTSKGRGIVGAADIHYCYEIDDESYAFGLENPIKFPHPIPCPGALNFWKPKRPEQHRAFAEAIAILKNI
jgi:predicted transcriptional regulator